MENNQTKQKKQRYFVLTEGAWRTVPLENITFSNLKEASDHLFGKNYANPKDYVIAKEIGIKTELDEKNLKYKISPVGDFKSKLPYYYIFEYSSGEGFEIKSFKKMNELVELGMPNKDNGVYIAKGLEVKLED